MRRDVRVAEGARLESVCTGNRTEGSNPSLSAITLQKGPLTLRVQSRKAKNPHITER